MLGWVGVGWIKVWARIGKVVILSIPSEHCSTEVKAYFGDECGTGVLNFKSEI